MLGPLESQRRDPNTDASHGGGGRMTLSSIHSLVLLASREELHRVWGRFDHERPGLSTNQLIVIVAMIVFASITAVLWTVLKSRASRTFSSDSPTSLFRELCAAHGIKRTDRRLLRKLAEFRGITNPAILFVEPQCFETQHLRSELQASAKELRMLNEKLFG
jgi:hypothetical protein